MRKTLILTNNTKERSSQVLGSIISHSKIKTYMDHIDYDRYDNLLMLVDLDQVLGQKIESLDGDKTFLEMTNYVKVNFLDKKIKLGVLFDASQIYQLNECVRVLKNNVMSANNFVFINKDVENDAISSALEIREEFDIFNSSEKLIDKSKLKEIIDGFILDHKTLNLASCSADVPRSTILEYIYHEGSFYIITEGGIKFSNLLINERASISIHDEFTSMAKVKGLVVYTKSELLDLKSQEYKMAMALRGLDENKLSRLDIDLYVLKLSPLDYIYTDFSLRVDGYSPYQFLNSKDLK